MHQRSSSRRRRGVPPVHLALVLTGVPLLLAGAASQGTDAPERPLPDAGVAVSVGADDGTLLVATTEGFDLLVLDAGAVVVDGHGRGIGLEAVRAGDRLAYVITPWAGMSLSPTLRVLGRPEPVRREGGHS